MTHPRVCTTHRFRSALAASALLLGQLFATTTAAPLAYLTQLSNVAVVNADTRTLITTVPAGSGPFAIGAAPGLPYVYVANTQSDDVTVIEVASNTVLTTIPVGNNPYGVALTPDGSRVYVANFLSHTVSVIDTSTQTVVATIPVALNPSGLVVSQDGTRLYGTAGGANSIFAINTATNTVVDTLNVGLSPWGIVLSPDDTRAYVVHFSGASMAVIDTSDLSLITTVPIGNAPVDVAISADGSHVYAVNRDSDSVSVLAPDDNTVIATIPVGDRPHGIDLHPNGLELYVTNANSNSVSVIDDATLTVIDTITGLSLPGSFGTFFAGTPTTVPGAPTINGVVAGDGSAELSFQAPASDGGSPIIAYQALCQPGAVSADDDSSPIVVTGLSNGTTYSCAVTASNSVGSGAPSASVQVTPMTVPGAPRNVSVAPLNQAARFNFDPPLSDGGSQILDYDVACEPGGHGITGPSAPIDLSGLQNNVTYRCALRARNSVGFGPDTAAVSVIPGLAATSVDLSISKTNATNFVNDGDYVGYQIVVSNPGPGAVVGARVQDDLGSDFSAAAWQCASANGAFCINAGNGAMDIQVDLPAQSAVTILWAGLPIAGPETPISNVASVAPPAGINDPNLANNVAADGPDIRGIFRDSFE